jgi:hypothetical protein
MLHKKSLAAQLLSKTSSMMLLPLLSHPNCSSLIQLIPSKSPSIRQQGRSVTTPNMWTSFGRLICDKRRGFLRIALYFISWNYSVLVGAAVRDGERRKKFNRKRQIRRLLHRSIEMYSRPSRLPVLDPAGSRSHVRRLRSRYEGVERDRPRAHGESE